MIIPQETHGEKLCQIHRDQRGFILDFVYLRVCFGVVFWVFFFFFKFAHIQTFPELDNQFSVWTSVHGASSATFLTHI